MQFALTTLTFCEGSDFACWMPADKPNRPRSLVSNNDFGKRAEWSSPSFETDACSASLGASTQQSNTFYPSWSQSNALFLPPNELVPACITQLNKLASFNMHPYMRKRRNISEVDKKKIKKNKEEHKPKSTWKYNQINTIFNCKFLFTPEDEMRNEDGAEFTSCEDSFRGSSCWREGGGEHFACRVSGWLAKG